MLKKKKKKEREKRGRGGELGRNIEFTKCENKKKVRKILTKKVAQNKEQRDRRCEVFEIRMISGS